MWRNAGNIFFLFPLVILLLAQGTARADIVSGSVEFLNQTGNTDTTDAAGLTTESRSKYFLQRYNLYYTNRIYPLVNLYGGMRLQKEAFSSEIEGITSRTDTTLAMPVVNLTFMNRFVSAGIGYDERDETVETAGNAFTTYRKTKNVFLGFKPEGLPTLDLQYIGESRFDKDRISLDQDDNMFSVGSLYRPVKSVQLNYNAVYDDVKYHLTQGETESLTQSGKMSYNDRFFDGRVTLTASYIITGQTVQATSGGSGGGTVQLQLFPVTGLSAINDTPLLTVLDVNPALIDANLTVSSGINIGQLPSQTSDTKQRQVGLDFGVETEMSTLYVWVDKALSAVVADSFAWDVYTSQDNQNWSLSQTVFPATFGQFDNRFEIALTGVKTRYIKVVTRPLSVAVVPPPGEDISSIVISELQAFLDQPVDQVAGPTTTTVLSSERVNLNGRVHFIRTDRHTLLYDLYIQDQRSDQTGQPTSHSSTLTNAIIGSERFSKVFTGTAKVLVQNNKYPDGTLLTYTDYEASLMATANSLPKISHNFVATAKREEWVETTIGKDTVSLYLGNAAEVYAGINAYLNGGESVALVEIESAVSRIKNTQLSFGIDLVPHRALTMNLNYDWSESVQQGESSDEAIPSLAIGTTIGRRTSTGANAAYNPVSSLYLYGSIQRVEETGKPGVTYGSLSGAWSAQPRGGSLEIRLTYAENEQTETRTNTRSYGPYAKWKINMKAYLEASYLVTTVDSPTEQVESRTVNTGFKWMF